MPDPLNRERALAVLYDLAFTIGAEVELPLLLTRSLQRFLYHTGFPVGLMVSDELRLPGQNGFDVRLDVAIGDYGLRRQQGQRWRVPEALLATHPLWLDTPALLASLGTRHPMSVALSLPVEGYGHMLLLSPAAQAAELPYEALFVPVLSRLGTAIRLCMGYARDVQARIEREANFNALSGLPNATRFNRMLHDEAARADASGGTLAVLCLDVDDFGRVNAAWGPAGADRLLHDFAARLAARARDGEQCAHLMADEFAILLPDVQDRAGVEARVRALLDDQHPLLVAGHALQVRASAGVALYPEDAADCDLVLRYAQMAMHQAKQDARGSFSFFDAEQDRQAHARRSLLQRFRFALARDELRLFYQPKVDMLSGQLVGAEALLRWQDPERGLLPPGEFLGVVENSELICDLGRWVMEQALAQVRVWLGMGLRLAVSVNIAARHFEAPDFVAQVRRVLAAFPEVPPELLELEILESTAIADFGQAQEVLHACRELGVQTALDDFGTGYSSLAYLSRIPTQTLKIDQSFVRNMFEQATEPAVVRAIVQIAEIFGQRIVAEGVEEEAHGLALIAMGCRIAQGYGVAKPMPAADFPAWAANYRLPERWRQARSLRWSSGLYDLLRGHRALQQWLATQADMHGASAVLEGMPWLIDPGAVIALDEACTQRLGAAYRHFVECADSGQPLDAAAQRLLRCLDEALQGCLAGTPEAATV